jgi:hypothetical protein
MITKHSTEAEQIAQLRINATQIVELNAKRMQSVDKFYDRLYAGQSTTAIGSDVKNKSTRAYMPTAHDLAANNPLLRRILLDLQRGARNNTRSV